MLQRTALGQLCDWKRTKTQQALMIMGARQVGKTTLVREFARREYESIAEVNFYGNALAVQTLSAAVDVDDARRSHTLVHQQLVANTEHSYPHRLDPSRHRMVQPPDSTEQRKARNTWLRAFL